MKIRKSNPHILVVGLAEIPNLNYKFIHFVPRSESIKEVNGVIVGVPESMKFDWMLISNELINLEQRRLFAIGRKLNLEVRIEYGPESLIGRIKEIQNNQLDANLPQKKIGSIRNSLKSQVKSLVNPNSDVQSELIRLKKLFPKLRDETIRVYIYEVRVKQDCSVDTIEQEKSST